MNGGGHVSFKVTIDGIDVFDLSRKDKSLIDAKISDKLNEASSFSFKIPPMHEFLTNYNQVHLLRSTVLVEENNVNIFAGRASEINFDFNKDQEIFCEGQLSYFNDSLQPPAEFDTTTIPDFLKTLVANHNAQVEENRRFEVGNVTFSSEKKIYRKLNYEKTLDCLKQMLLQAEGGYLFCRYENGKNYIDYVEELTDISNQPVEFAVNMQDLTIKQTGDPVFTQLYVRGTKEQSTSTSTKTDTTYDRNKWIHIPKKLTKENGKYICTYDNGDYRDVTNKVVKNGNQIILYYDSTTGNILSGPQAGSKSLSLTSVSYPSKLSRGSDNRITCTYTDGHTIDVTSYVASNRNEYMLMYDKKTGQPVRFTGNYSSEYGKITAILDLPSSAKKAPRVMRAAASGSTSSEDNYVYYSNNPVKNDLLISLFGPIGKIYDLGDKYGSQENMKKKAEEYLEKHKMDYLTIEATGIDLSYLNKKWNKYKMGQVVYIRSVPHDINTMYAITSMDTDLNKQQRIIKTGTEQNQDLTEITKQETKTTATATTTKYVRQVHIPKKLEKNEKGRYICTYDNGDYRDVTDKVHQDASGTGGTLYYDKTTGYVLNDKNSLSNALSTSTGGPAKHG